MRLRFLGTRGEIDARSSLHRRHSALLAGRLLVDCGADWLGALDEIRPQAIVVTHAHPDHAGGLREGAPCPVWATSETWERLPGRWPLEGRVLEPGRGERIAQLSVEAVPVEHSLRAPAVAVRLQGRVLYVPDVVAIPDGAFADVELYVGDGASLTRPIVRRRDGARIGHASVREQIEWCAAHGVPRALFTHCGSQIVRDHDAAEARVRELGRERGVSARIAVDGLELRV